MLLKTPHFQPKKHVRSLRIARKNATFQSKIDFVVFEPFFDPFWNPPSSHLPKVSRFFWKLFYRFLFLVQTGKKFIFCKLQNIVCTTPIFIFHPFLLFFGLFPVISKKALKITLFLIKKQAFNPFLAYKNSVLLCFLGSLSEK